MINRNVNPGASPQVSQSQELEDLLTQGKMRLAKSLGQEPTQAQDFTSFMNLLGSSRMGGDAIQAEQQRQIENEAVRNQQLQSFITTQEELGMREQEQQRLLIHQAHQRAMSEGNFAAGIMQSITNGNQNDIIGLSQFWISELQASGQDDDNIDPRMIQGILTQEYQQGIASGKYEGPTSEISTLAPGAPIVENGNLTGEHTPYAPGMSPTEVENRAHDRAVDLLEKEYNLRTQFERDKAEMVAGDQDMINWLITDPENNFRGVARGPKDASFYVAPDGNKRPMPGGSGGFRVASETAAAENRLAQIQQRAEKSIRGKETEVERTMFEAAKKGVGVIPTVKAAIDAVIGGLGIARVFGNEEGMFKESQEARQFLRTMNERIKRTLAQNPRFAEAEVKRLGESLPDPDRAWQNPDTASNNIIVLRNTLNEIYDTTNSSLFDAITVLDFKEISRLMTKQAEIERMLIFFGGPSSIRSGQTAEEISPEDRDLIDFYLNK